MIEAAKLLELSNLEQLCQGEDLKNLDLLDSGATDHAHNSRDAFSNFRPVREGSPYGYRGTKYLSRSRRYCQEVHPFGCYILQCPLHSYPGQQPLQCGPFMP